MELDLMHACFDLKQITPGEIEECLEDPYALRILPEIEHGPRETRYYLIGKTLRNRCLFFSFTTNGKLARVIFARSASDLEQSYYERLQAEI